MGKAGEAGLGKLDAVAKKYLGKQEAFADVFNYLLFDGKQVIKPNELSELDSNQVAVLFKDNDIQQVQKQRDLLKLWTAMTNGRVIMILLGQEIQGTVHYAMPVKDGMYDFIAYDDQISEIANRNREEGVELRPGGEYLYGFRKEDKIKPVITATIYVGSESWDGPMRLSDLFDDDVKQFLVNDYKLSLISAADMDDAEFGKFSTELGDVMKFVKHQKEDVDKLIEQTNHRIYSPEAAAFVKEAANMDLDFEVKNGGVDMCEALEKRYKEKEQNVMVQSIINLMNNMKWNIDQAMDALSIPSDQRSMYAGMVNKK